MRPRLTVFAPGVLLLAVAGCVDGTDGVPPPGSSAAGRSCPPGGDVTELGSSFADGVPTRVTVSAGAYEFSASGFLHDGPFDPEVGRTAVYLGPGDVTPTYDRASGKLVGATVTFVVAEDRPALVDLTAGTYWVVNSNGVVIRARPCGNGSVTRE